jgi:hypothetical protein
MHDHHSYGPAPWEQSCSFPFEGNPTLSKPNNSSPASQAARTAHNAAVSNAPRPAGQGPVPVVAGLRPMQLPPVIETQPKPAFGPGTKRSGGK